MSKRYSEDQVIDFAIANGLSRWATAEPLLLSEWADKNFYLSAEASSVEGRWESLPYQVAILNWIGSDDIEVVSWQKSARTGYTKCIVAAIGYFAEHKHRNQLLYQPTDSDAVDFVRDELNPMLRDVDIVRVKLKVDPEKKSSDNTNEKKVFTGSILDIKGGKAGRNYRRMTKDIVFYDELDGFDNDIEGEGSPISLGDTRIETSSFPKSVRGSTPKIDKTSIIKACVAESDNVFKRYLPCPHCGHMQALEWERMKWENDDPETVKYMCAGKNCAIDYPELPDMDAKGRWISEEGTYYDEKLDQFFSAEHEPIRHPRSIGIKIWSAYSYFKGWPDLVDQFIKAWREKKAGQVKKFKTFVNTKLGETWKEYAEDRQEDSILELKDERLRGLVPGNNQVAALVAGVDTQDDGFFYTIVAAGYGLEGDQWLVREGKVATLEFLEKVLWHDQYMDAAGFVYPVQFTLQDAMGHRTSEVYKFCRKHPGKILPSAGERSMAQPYNYSNVEFWPGTKKPFPGGLQRIRINTTYYKNQISGKLGINPADPGAIHFHSNISDDFASQLCAEYRDEHGVWKQIGNRANHYFDCITNVQAAIDILGVCHFALPGEQYEEEPEAYTSSYVSG